MLSIKPIKAFTDNYIWVIHSATSHDQVVVIDPGQAQPVLNYLEEHQLSLAAIFVTHHHHDHTGGIKTLISHFDCPVYAGIDEPVKHITHPLADNETFEIPELDLTFTAFHIPGHTRGHIAYYGHDAVFVGDTLFAGGCGRIFEGTPEQMYQSLQRIAALPRETLIYCAHEYTQQNLEFGLMIEPNNQNIASKLELVKTLRQHNRCTLPTNLSEELDTNIFLRCHQDSVQNSMKQCATTLEIFTALRKLKTYSA